MVKNASTNVSNLYFSAASFYFFPLRSKELFTIFDSAEFFPWGKVNVIILAADFEKNTAASLRCVKTQFVDARTFPLLSMTET
jgi:hypothetical protein